MILLGGDGQKAKTEESVRVVPIDKNVIQVLKELKIVNLEC